MWDRPRSSWHFNCSYDAIASFSRLFSACTADRGPQATIQAAETTRNQLYAPWLVSYGCWWSSEVVEGGERIGALVGGMHLVERAVQRIAGGVRHDGWRGSCIYVLATGLAEQQRSVGGRVVVDGIRRRCMRRWMLAAFVSAKGPAEAVGHVAMYNQTD